MSLYNKYIKYKNKYLLLKGGAKTITINDRAFNEIKNGNKTIEGRVLKKFFEDLKVGETITFKNSKSEEVKKKISNIIQYNNFSEMLEKEDFKKVLPYDDILKIEDGVSYYTRLYEGTDLENCKVIAIHLI